MAQAPSHISIGPQSDAENVDTSSISGHILYHVAYDPQSYHLAIL